MDINPMDRSIELEREVGDDAEAYAEGRAGELLEMLSDDVDDDDVLFEDEYGEYDESMDGDHASGLASAGWGTDEDYGYDGGDSEW